MAQRTEQELIGWIGDELTKADKHLRQWREDARLAYDFVAGRQWSQADINAYQRTNRIPIVFNYILRVINVILGLEINNRQETRYLPREIQDNAIAGVMDAAAKWVRDETDAEDEESDAYEDMLICGTGWTETRMDYNEDLDGKVDIGRIDPLDMLYDVTSKRKNITNTKWRSRRLRLDDEEVKELFGESALTDLTVSMGEESDTTTFVNPGRRYLDDFIEDENLESRKRFSVAQFQWWENDPVYRVVVDGKETIISQKEFKKLEQGLLENNTNFQQQNIQFVKQQKKVFHQVFYANRKLLDRIDDNSASLIASKYPAPINDFTFQPMTGIRDRNRNLFRGLVFYLLDPQRWYNKWLAQTIHIVDTNAKGGFLAETGAFMDIREAEARYAQADSIIELNPGGLSKIQPKEAPAFPPAIDKLLQHSLDSISDVAGISLETLGMASKNQPMGLEFTRKETGVTMLAKFFNSLRAYRKSQGDVVAQFIQKYISDGRLVRVVGAEGASIVPLMKDATAFKYDVVVDESPSSPTNKSRVFNALMQIVPLAMQSGMPIPPEVLDYMPLPEPLIQKWKEGLAPEQDPAEEQMKQKMQQLQLQMAELQVEQAEVNAHKTSSETIKNMASAREIATEGALNVAKGHHEAALAADEAAQAADKLGLDEDAFVREEQRKDEAFLREQQRKDMAAELEMQRKLQQPQGDDK